MRVTTSAGVVEGLERDGLHLFRGMPFAAPPLGPRRFRPPAPVEPWEGVRQAATFGPMAPQAVDGIEAMLGGATWTQDEDCLYLNVATPACDDAARPVMVWIHGGAFQTGAGSLPWYHGTRLAARDGVVAVALNYRLGVLGFTYLGGLGETYAGSANVGILDQVAALDWVRTNIAAFGGDPANVTVFGESAGGMSVSTLLGTPRAAGLFQRAIAQSGAANAVSTLQQASAITARLSAEVGVEEALLEASVADLMAAQRAISNQSFGLAEAGGGLLPFQPVVDGIVLARPPLDAIAGGSAAGVDLLAGSTRDEFTLFSLLLDTGFSDDHLVNRMGRLIGDHDRAREVIAAYGAAHPSASTVELGVRIATDVVFRVPIEDLLTAQSSHGRTFSYLFSYECQGFDKRLKACHALDIPFVFDVVDRPGNEPFVGPATSAVRALAASMRSAWTTFARTGRPAAEGLPAWPGWDPESRLTMELSLEPRLLADPAAAARAALV